MNFDGLSAVLRAALRHATVVCKISCAGEGQQQSRPTLTLTLDDGYRNSLRNVGYQLRAATAGDVPVLVRAGSGLQSVHCLVSVGV
jgi:hypothetical protein